MFSKGKKFMLVFVCLLLVGSMLLGGCQPNDTTRDAVSLGTSSVGSVFYILSVGMAEIISSDTELSASAEPVGGSDATLRGLNAENVNLGMTNAAAVYNAYKGIEQFEEDGAMPISLIAQGQQSLRQLVVTKRSNINSPADLAGKRIIARRSANPDMEDFAYAMLDVYNIPQDSVTILETAETQEAIEALKLGSADGAIIPGGVGSSFLLDLAESTEVVFIDIPDAQLNVILEKLGPAFIKGTIPAGTYRGQTNSVSTMAMNTLLVVRDDVSDDAVYQITKALLGQPKKLEAIHASGKEWNVEHTLNAFPIPFHPGVIRYFQEINVWNEEAEIRQQEVMK